MVDQATIAQALQRAGVNVYGLKVEGPMVSGTVGTGEERFKAVQAIMQVATDAQANIQVNEGFAAQSGGGGQEYTIQSGDSLSKIAQKFYGDASQWKKIHEANKDQISNPDVIQAGAKITIPG